MKEAALLGFLLLHELIVYRALFPCDLILAIEGKEKDFWFLLFMLRWRGWWIRVSNGYGGGSDRRGRQGYWPAGAWASIHGSQNRTRFVQFKRTKMQIQQAHRIYIDWIISWLALRPVLLCCWWWIGTGDEKGRGRWCGEEVGG